jgi:hypothetical protein
MLSGLTKLTTLDLTSTLTNQPLTSTMFNDTTSVKFLKLSRNNIHDLPTGIFRNMKSIENLDLSYNTLSSFVDIDREIFGAMPNLTQISLVRNAISQIAESNQVKNFLSRNNTIIDLLHNTFDCSCNNIVFCQWLQNSTLQQHFKHYNNYTCTSPVERYGRRVADKSLVDDVKKSCGSSLEVWKIVITSAGGVVIVVMVIILILYYKHKLYILRLFEYRLREQIRNEYDFYVSYLSSDVDTVEAIVGFIESISLISQRQRNRTVNNTNEQAHAPVPMTSAAAAAVTSDVDGRERLIDNTDGGDIVEVQHEHVINAADNRATYRVFYEDRDSRADEWDLEQLARAVYRSTSVILCLTPDYLRDRRRQYEMALAQDAMVHRCGDKARDHVIVIVLRELEEVASHVPDILRGHFNRKDVIVWNTDTEQQQRPCHSALQQKLSIIT